MKRPHGETWRGEFKDDKLNGVGSIAHPNGTVLEGSFKDFKMHGHGKITLPDGTIYQQGYFNEGEYLTEVS